MLIEYNLSPIPLKDFRSKSFKDFRIGSIVIDGVNYGDVYKNITDFIKLATSLKKEVNQRAKLDKDVPICPIKGTKIIQSIVNDCLTLNKELQMEIFKHKDKIYEKRIISSIPKTIGDPEYAEEIDKLSDTSIEHFIIRIGTISTFANSTKHQLFGFKTRYMPVVIGRLKRGDIMWFVRSSRGSPIYAVAKFEHYIEPDDAPTQTELGWPDNVYNTFHNMARYSNFIELEKHFTEKRDLKTHIWGQVVFRPANDKCAIDLPALWREITDTLQS